MNLGVLHLGIHESQYMVPLDQVERVIRMAQFTPLPAADLPANQHPQVVGVLNVAGELRAVVSARKVLGLPDAAITPSQRLLLLKGQPPFLLWVDDILGFLEVSMLDFKPIRYSERSPIEAVIRTPQGNTPVLRPEFFQPDHFWEPG
ncbi:chemotaxis protein CheW [Deinococcus roseus]|uniref:CheW-like domain-containing protein n=1 Tax=Deinococcus roseus TaxID=392414 RepID=A0ABQ2D0K3_9DEIO|nr:chemotaxis protein CheW [Deinococcus roseus]GGJ39207.1 hypothetical protein GCM10008938_26540 [Deinococcus roseus]